MWQTARRGLRVLSILLFGVPAVALGQSASGFDAAGRTTIRIGAQPTDGVNASARLASGALFLAGSFGGGLASQAFLARFLPDGTPDPSFGTGGVVTLPARSFGYAVAPHPAGGAVLLATVGSSSAPDVAVARFTDTGALDPTWGTGGIATATIPDLLGVGGVAVSAVGHVYVSGGAGNPARAMVLRFDTTGVLDPLYGSGGIGLSGVADTTSTRLFLTATGVVYAAGVNGVFALGRDLAVFCFNTAGNPCAGFGGGTGMATSSLGTTRSFGQDVAIDGLGRVVVAGNTEGIQPQAAVARFIATGAADAGFNGGLGYRILGLSGVSGAQSVEIDAVNRIVVGGFQATDLFLDTPRLAMAARVTALGAADGTFGTGGLFTKALDGVDLMTGVSIDAVTGRILLAGSTGPASGISSAVTLALTAAGIPDPAYGSGGIVISALSSTAYSPVSDVAVQPDGRMLVAGGAAFSDGQHPYVARLNLDGTFDPSFGGAGVLTLPSTVGKSISRIAVAADGSSVAVLSLPPSKVSHALIHLGTDGSLDTGFGSAGLAQIPQIPNPIFVNLLPLPDGGVLASGRENSALGEIIIAKFTAQGALDGTFGAGGVTKLAGSSGVAREARVLTDGRILLAATIGTAPGLIRLIPTGEADPAFDADGLASLAVMGSGTDLLSADDTGTLLGGFLIIPPGGIVLARFDPNGIPDPGFGTGGVVTDSNVAPTTGFAGMAADGAGCVLVAGTQGPSDTRRAALARFLPDGAPDPTFGTGGGMTADLGPSLFTTAFALDGTGNALIGGSIASGIDVLGLVARMPAACNDGNACTTDQCAAGVGCAHTPLVGIPGARCLCGVVPAICAGQAPPANVGKKADKACSALAAAESSEGKKRKKQLAKARRLLKQATRNAARAGRGKKPKLAKECAAALGANFTEQRARALEAIKGG